MQADNLPAGFDNSKLEDVELYSGFEITNAEQILSPQQALKAEHSGEAFEWLRQKVLTGERVLRTSEMPKLPTLAEFDKKVRAEIREKEEKAKAALAVQTATHEEAPPEADPESMYECMCDV